jgi:hypothetical protein
MREYEEARRMLVRAVAATKAEEFKEARRYLEWMLTIPSTSDQKSDAYYWLSVISHDPDEKRSHLQSALGYNGAHHRARKQLAILDGKIKQDELIDPDRYRQPVPEDPQAVEGERFGCPNCGGKMAFSPDGARLVCEYCEQGNPGQQQDRLQETDFVVGISTAGGRNKAVATLSFECRSCGAVFLLAPETLSLTCPHCDSAYSISKSETRALIPPEGIIPFKFAAVEAAKLARSWFRKTYSSKKSAHISSFTGIYLPAWTFDVAGYVGWRGQVYEDDSILNVSGKEVILYDDIFVEASAPLPPYFQQLLKQFTAGDVRPFGPEFTASWLAETYTISMSDAALEARSLAFKDAKKTLARKDELRRISNIQFTSDEIVMASFKLVLVPVWVGHFSVNSETHDLTINGHTGTVYGLEPPGKLEKLVTWLLGD